MNRIEHGVELGPIGQGQSAIDGEKKENRHIAELSNPELRKKVFAVIKRKFPGISDADADDIFQEAMFKAARYINDGKYDERRSSVSSFVAMIAVSKGHDFSRATKKHGSDVELEGTILPQIDNGFDLRLNRADLLKALETLTPNQRQAMELLLAGEDPDEVARIMGIDKRTVYSKLHKTLAKLRSWGKENTR